uniref:Uncharacterized protein n=1 Tax=Rhizophora mucronata TaxID=61149 RepID=A0A2P2PCS3_RHIMU
MLGTVFNSSSKFIPRWPPNDSTLLEKSTAAQDKDT